MDKKKALDILHSHMQNENLRKHCYAVGFAMSALYEYLKENNWDGDSPDDKETWEVLGILHDSDYEITRDNPKEHTLHTLKWMEEAGVDKESPLYKAVQSHNNKVTGLREPQTQMEWALECCDELTGLIVACALVQPDKKLNSVRLESVQKKWDSNNFAAGVHREQIEQCEEKLNIPLDTFITVVLESMQKNSDELGL